MAKDKEDVKVELTVQLTHTSEDLGKGFAERDQLAKSKETAGEVFFHRIKNDG